MTNDTVTAVRSASGGVHEQIESFLQMVMQGLMGKPDQDVVEGPGRLVTVPSMTLWMAVLVAVLRGLRSQRAIWRLIAAGGWWKQQGYDVGDQAVYKRLEQEGWKPLAQVFERVSLLLAQWLEPALHIYQQRHSLLASFASEVVALDEMHLDQVSRRLPILRHFKKGDKQLLPGKLVALFDVRLQQWRAIEYMAQGTDNGLGVACGILASVKQGALVLADLGYFGFRWFDELTEQGYCWISRVKEGTTITVLHTGLLKQEIPLIDLFGREPWTPWANMPCGRFNFGREDSFGSTSPMCVIQQSCPSQRLPDSMLADGILNWPISHLERVLGIASDMEQQIGGRFVSSVGVPHHCSSAPGHPHGGGLAGRCGCL